MQSTRHDLPMNVRSSICEKMQPYLATLLDLKMQAKQAHWNVKGENFLALHELFDKIAGESDGYADDVAERIVQLGGTAEGLSKTVVSRSALPEFLAQGTDWTAFVTTLANSLAAAAKMARTAIDEMDKLGDKDTADLMTGVSRGLDKSLWMVEAHLYKK